MVKPNLGSKDGLGIHLPLEYIVHPYWLKKQLHLGSIIVPC